ncbi:T3SS regulon anti-activator ExsD domain-containing protein [Pseudomonas aeruginosa]|uniref:T3SS regulon anti-activator ExsD domain-containing protein n=1 Tax=Pseudomonas aeruginosa TaxID=287 RepID=UPI00071B5E29|nr:T3SS regulon anti-activator ExsD domain-containing protein [Pseudomonas aeruginosa]KSP33454.1 ExsD [Pseudomonas aeruginosa]
MEQEDDKQYSREAVFAGRRVSVVGSDARSRGRVPGYASSSLYRESGIISARQLALLQRMLPRLRLEQLFRCEWLQQRLARGLALGREEVRQILLCAAQDDDGWCAELGDRVNLAVPQSMIDWVLLPVYGWWESLLDQAIPGWRLSLVELETQSRQLRVKSEFWSRVAELEPEQAREELARVAKCQARTQEQGGLAGFEPIPEVLECLWQPLCRLDDDVGAADAVQAWLHERNLCQAQDHFYWQS